MENIRYISEALNVNLEISSHIWRSEITLIFRNKIRKMIALRLVLFSENVRRVVFLTLRRISLRNSIYDPRNFSIWQMSNSTFCKKSTVQKTFRCAY